MIAFATEYTSDLTFEERLREDNGYVRNLIKKKARLLCQERGYPLSDIDDIAQDLFIHLWKRRFKFDSNRSKWTTFTYRALERGMQDLVEKREAKMRKPSRCTDRDVSDNDLDGSPLAGVQCDDVRRHRGISSRPLVDAGSLGFDIRETLSRRPEPLRNRCLQFMEYGTIEEVARISGDSKYQIRNDRAAILEFVGEMHLADYRR